MSKRRGPRDRPADAGVGRGARECAVAVLDLWQGRCCHLIVVSRCEGFSFDNAWLRRQLKMCNRACSRRQSSRNHSPLPSDIVAPSAAAAVVGGIDRLQCTYYSRFDVSHSCLGEVCKREDVVDEDGAVGVEVQIIGSEIQVRTRPTRTRRPLMILGCEGSEKLFCC